MEIEGFIQNSFSSVDLIRVPLTFTAIQSRDGEQGKRPSPVATLLIVLTNRQYDVVM